MRIKVLKILKGLNLKKVRRNKKGFSLVEVILSISLFGIVSLGLASGLVVSIQNSELSSYRTGAIFLAEEGLEAIRSIRDIDYSNLTDGSYGLSLAGSNWVTSGSSDLNGEYVRSVDISTVDSETKLVTSTVTWPSFFSANNSVVISSYFTNWLRTVILDYWTNPTLADSFNLLNNGGGTKITYINDYSYIIRNGGSPNFLTIDVDGALSVTNSQTITSAPINIAVSPNGNFGAIASSSNSSELQIFNLSSPSNPTMSSTYNASSNHDANGVFIDSSNYVYFVRSSAGGGDEFFIVQVNNPNIAPTFIGSDNYSGGTMYEVVVSGNYAYVSTSSNSEELVVYDVSDKANPNEVASYDKPGNSNCLTVAYYSNTVYLGCEDEIIYSIDVTNPLSPTFLDSLDVDDDVNDIDINPTGTIAFLALDSGPREFTTINISDPSDLTIRGELNLSSTASGVVYDYDRDKSYVAFSSNSAEFLRINEQ